MTRGATFEGVRTVATGALIGGLFVTGVIAACGSDEPRSPTLIDPQILPPRGGPKEDVLVPQPAATTPVDAAPPSRTCTAPDLVLCFRFEGAARDESPLALVPATTVTPATAPPEERHQT